MHGEIISCNAREISFSNVRQRGMEQRIMKLTLSGDKLDMVGVRCLCGGQVGERSTLMGSMLLSPCCPSK